MNMLERRRQMIAAASGKKRIVWNQLVVNGNFAEDGDNPTGWTKAIGNIEDMEELGGENLNLSELL